MDDSELASLRAEAEKFLPSTCTIRRITRTPDGAGGQTATPSDLATGVACRLSPAGNGSERQIANKLTAVNVWVLTLPAETDIRADDEVIVGSRTLQVASVLSRDWEITRRVVCVENK